MNARIFGVSKDDVASHKSFRAKFDLPFPLIADTDRTISEAYGAVKEKNMFGKIVNGVRLQTINSLRGLNYLMGQSSGLSTQDIYTIDWMYRPFAPTGFSTSYPGGTPTMSWSAYSGATQYSVDVVAVYEEWDYERGYSTSEYYERGVGSTTGLSLQDTQASYTGNMYCDVYNGTYGNAYYSYWYELVAHLPGGIISRGVREPAYISTC